MLLVVAAPCCALAHAELRSVLPPSGAIVPRGGVVVQLVFSETVALLRRGVRVVTPDGTPETPAVQVRGRTIDVRFAGARAGTYAIGYRVIDDDTHISRGVVSINVERASTDAAGAAVAQSTLASTLARALESIAHWMHYAGFGFVFGVLALSLITGRREPRPIVGAGVALLIVADVFVVLAEASAIEPNAIVDLDALGDVLGSSFGALTAIDFTGALLAWAVIPLLAERRRGLGLWLITADGFVLALIDGRMGHGIAGLPWSASAAISGVHLIGMALWVGAVVSFADARAIVRWALAFAIASGALMLVFHLKRPADLIDDAYGVAILTKTGFTVLAIFAGYLARRSAQRRGWLTIEAAAIGALLLGAGCALTLTPPR